MPIHKWEPLVFDGQPGLVRSFKNNKVQIFITNSPYYASVHYAGKCVWAGEKRDTFQKAHMDAQGYLDHMSATYSEALNKLIKEEERWERIGLHEL